jgi:hypothetical protein
MKIAIDKAYNKQPIQCQCWTVCKLRLGCTTFLGPIDWAAIGMAKKEAQNIIFIIKHR